MSTSTPPSLQVAATDSDTLNDLRRRYADFRAMELSLDMTRGKPCPEQLDLANGMLDCVTSTDYKTASGIDCRNYGGFEGLPEARALLAPLLEVDPEDILIGGNSSLLLMHDAVARCFLHGTVDSDQPWRALPDVKFLCPVPGYDRHFAICEKFGIQMIPVASDDRGPDMDEVERLVAADPAIKGIWIVPKYGNPTGAIVSPENVHRLAQMRTAADDFRIFWDNAYAVHHLRSARPELANILQACEGAENDNRVFLFASTSKISFAGAGLSLMGASTRNIEWMRAHGTKQSIGPDKLNQLRHVRFFGDFAGIEAHMVKHAAVIRPKFDMVLEILDEELGGTDAATWTKPDGGYFISLDTKDGCAQRTVQLAADAGVKMTPAGATFPYRADPRDRNIRIAPTLPSVDNIRQAMRIVSTCLLLATAEKYGAGSTPL
jgi:DNA-binding transcriptional MocR family regulator